MTAVATDTRKVVVNACHGGFGLSAEATAAYLARKGKQVWWFRNTRTNDRIDFRSYEPCPDPDKEFVAYAYTTPDPDFGSDDNHFYDRDIPRDDPDLVAVVEELGTRANDRFAELVVLEIPAHVDWQIEEYDGAEWIAEKHQRWEP